MIATPPIALRVGDRDITRAHDGLAFGNVDPGGYESLTANPRALDGIRPGAPVVARCGLDTVFYGRVNDPDQKQDGHRDTYGLTIVGAGDLLKRGRIQEIWVDRDLSRWGELSVARRYALLAAGSDSGGSGSVAPDEASLSPSLELAAGPKGATTNKEHHGSCYRSGGVAIGSIYYAWAKSANIALPDANWIWAVQLCTDDTFASFDNSGNLAAAGPGTGTLTATAARTCIQAELYYNTAGVLNEAYRIFWTCLAVYGTHGLTKRGTADATNAQGFYPDDIAWDAVRRAGGIVRGRVDQASTYIVQHCTEITPVPHEKVTLDMAQIMGWHTGVWEPLSLFDDDPAWYFHARPDRPTCSVSRYECEEADLPKVRLDQLFDTAKVAWRDSAGTQGVQTVTINNPYLQEAGITGQVLDLDLGIGSAGSAAAYGTFALKLALAASRGSGYAVLPQWVRDPGGGLRPSCTLKAGRDRVQIRNLPDPGPLTATDTQSYDSFRIARVQITVNNGVAKTRVDFDGGADLMEVLNARSAQARVLTGTG